MVGNAWIRPFLRVGFYVSEEASVEDPDQLWGRKRSGEVG